MNIIIRIHKMTEKQKGYNLQRNVESQPDDEGEAL